MFGAGRWEGETEDLGALGCRFISRLALRPGETVQLSLGFAGVPFRLDVAATVAWAARQAPWHTGVAFARGQEATARRFVDAVKGALPRPSVREGRPGFLESMRRSVPRQPRPAERVEWAAPREPPSAPQATLSTKIDRLSRAEALIEVARIELEAGHPGRALPWLLAAEQVAPEHPGIEVVRAALGL